MQVRLQNCLDFVFIFLKIDVTIHLNFWVNPQSEKKDFGTGLSSESE